jgi:hypothetical protein
VKPHELSNTTRRNFAAGLVGGIPLVGFGLAPRYHDAAVLDGLRVDVEDWTAERIEIRGNVKRVVTGLLVSLDNQTTETLTPVFSNWDQKRRTRHNWPIADGREILPVGKSDRYRITAPNDEAVLHLGFRAQLTVFQRGEERWQTVTFTPGDPQ